MVPVTAIAMAVQAGEMAVAPLDLLGLLPPLVTLGLTAGLFLLLVCLVRFVLAVSGGVALTTEITVVLGAVTVLTEVVLDTVVVLEVAAVVMVGGVAIPATVPQVVLLSLPFAMAPLL